MYDVIVIGARVAGASTALLLARRGLNVLVVDRARFPSDTLSTHQVQVPAAARLKRWGILPQIEAAGTPPTRRVRFDPGPAALDGHFPATGGVDALYSPRRRLLDTLLVEAARESGAEVRERFAVDELLFSEGAVTGIRGRERGRTPVRETAPLVVGADGRHSMVAKSVGAPAYHVKPPLSVAYYTYWSGVEMQGGEMYGRGRRLMGAWPTNDELVMTYVAAPADEFATFKADPEGSLLRAFDASGALGERIRAGERVERMYGTADLHNRFHRPYGPGWALVGDAGLLMDPVTGHGIADAFRDAELLTDAIVEAHEGRSTLEAALAAYQERRDAAALPMYELTTGLASFGPPDPGFLRLLQALERRPAEVDRFLGVLAGIEPLPEYFGSEAVRDMLAPETMAA